MSRQYDQTFLDIPGSLPEESYAYRDGTEYSAIDQGNNYYITNDGDVISFKNEEPLLMKTYNNHHGHHYVDLSIKHGKKDKLLIHRLVAEAFIPNPNNYPIVRHLDDNPDNNIVDNLAWGTQKDNHDDMIRNGHDVVSRKVYCFENDTVYDRCTDAAEDIGVSKSQITTCCQGKTGTANGYHFCYLEDKEEKMNDKNWLRVRNGFKPVIAISKDGNKIRFGSRKEAAEILGIPDCSISSVLTGHLKHTHGWRFVEDGDGT